jgi:hypothetical protein
MILLSVFNYLANLATRPRYEPRKSVLIPSASIDRCGLCPRCQAFVRLGLTDPEEDARCPSCGRMVGSLDALWPGGDAGG